MAKLQIRMKTRINMIHKLLLALVAGAVYADGVACSSPIPMLEETVSEVQSALESACSNKSDVKKVVENVFIPRVDSNLITKQVLGRKYWYESTDGQRKDLEGLLNRLIARHYAEAFKCDQLKNKMEFYPVRGEIKKYLRVESSVSISGQDQIQLRYAVRCVEGKWLIYDIVVNGLSLGQTYRSQFNPVLKKGGIADLIQYLTNKLAKEKDDIQSE